MSLTGALDGLVGDSIDGATGLLSGNTGDLIIFGGAIAIVLLLIGAFYLFVRMGRRGA